MARQLTNKFVDTEDVSLIMVETLTKRNILFRYIIKEATTKTDILQLLVTERMRDKKFDKAWRAAALQFEASEMLLREFDLCPEVPKECHTALICLTVSYPPVHTDFSRQFRALMTPGDFENFPYKAWCFLLIRALFTISSDISVQEVRMYRGIDTSLQPRLSMLKPGSYVSFNHFTPSSTNIKVPGLANNLGILIEVINMSKGTAMGISKHSKNEWEEEVFIVPWSILTVVSIDPPYDGSLAPQKLVLRYDGILPINDTISAEFILDFGQTDSRYLFPPLEKTEKSIVETQKKMFLEPPPTNTAIMASYVPSRDVLSNEKKVEAPTKMPIRKAKSLETVLESEEELVKKDEIDGTRRKVYPDGTIKKVRAEGIVMTLYEEDIFIREDNKGNVVRVNADGSVDRIDNNGIVRTICEDGTIRTTFTDGSVETYNLDGVIRKLFPDGTLRRTEPDGTVKTIHPDGTMGKHQLDGSVTKIYPDGTMERISVDGRATKVLPDGSVQRQE